MTLLKSMRAVILIALALISLAAISLPLVLNSSTVVVSSMSPAANCSGVSVGSRITSISGRNVASASDFSGALDGVKKGDFVPMLSDSQPSNCVALSDGDIGVEVTSLQKSGILQFGIDLAGGRLYNYQPSNASSVTQISGIASIISKRVSVFGLQGVTVSSDSQFVKVSAPRSADVNSLLFPGVFEARLMENVPVVNGAGKLSVGSNDYPFTATNSTLSINNQSIALQGSFTLNNIKFFFDNSTTSTVTVEAVIFNNSGISQSSTAQSSVTYNSNNNAYMFQLPVAISKDSANNFKNLTQRAPTTLLSGQIVLDGTLDYVMDGYTISRLSIPTSFISQISPNSAINVIGFAQNQQDANLLRLKLAATLQSGILSSKLYLASQEAVSPTRLGIIEDISAASLLTILFLILGLFIFRYKDFKGGFLSFVFVLMADISVLGLIYGSIYMMGTSLNLDFFSAIGLVVNLILSTVLLIMISEQNHHGRRFSLKMGYRKIIGMNASFYLASVIVSFAFIWYFTALSGLIILAGVIVNWVFLEGLFEKISKKTL